MEGTRTLSSPSVTMDETEWYNAKITMRVYFDYNATTPPSPEVVQAVVGATQERFGNASSVHHFGQQAKAVLDDARSAVAALLHADLSEVVFTSGGGETEKLCLPSAAD